MSDKTFLVKWKKRIGEAAADKITQGAATYGKSYHAIMESYLRNELDLNTLDSFDLNTFRTMQSTIDKIDNVVCVEQPLYSEKYRIAGTVDAIADFSKVQSIIDHKTSLKEKKESWIKNYFLQKTGYAVMFEELTGIKIEQMVTIITIKEFGGEPQVFVKRVADYKDELFSIIEAYYDQNH